MKDILIRGRGPFPIRLLTLLEAYPISVTDAETVAHCTSTREQWVRLRSRLSSPEIIQRYVYMEGWTLIEKEPHE